MPRGQVTVGNGTLQFASTARVSARNGAKLKHALRKSPSGVTLGNNEADGELTLDISEDGPERNFWKLLASGEVTEFIYEIPADDQAFEAVVSQIDVDFPNDDAVTKRVAWIGALVST
jgi:hypothetical protein